MLNRFDNYDEVYNSFNWSIPDIYNIASDTIDKYSHTERIALKHISNNGNCKEYSFKYFFEKSNRLANVLDSICLDQNDRVGIILGQCPETLISHIACFKSGKISIPLFSLFGDNALLFRLKDSDASTVICDDISLDKILRIKESLPNLRNIISINLKKSNDVVFSFFELIEKASSNYNNIKSKFNDPALIIYTSGTTGDPKGAVLPHKVLLGHIPGVEMPHEFLSSDLSVKDCFWTPADWAWIGGLFDVLMPSLYFGIPVISYRAPKFDPEFTFNLLEKYEVKNTFLPPTALKIMKSFRQKLKNNKLKLRTVGSGGESLGEELLNWGREVLNVGINEFYGQTECNLTISNCGLIMKQKLGSIGKPVPGHKVKLMNREGDFVKSEEEGQIVVNSDSPSTFLRYWKNKKETEKKIIDGWLQTGDYGIFDKEGYFYFKGRKDDLINSAGYRIGPSEIENSILSIKDVEMVAVIGVPDDLRGEIVKAVVVPKNISNVKSQNNLLKEKIKSHVKNKLAAHEYPRIIQFVSELPLTTTGKIKRNILRQNHLKELK